MCACANWIEIFSGGGSVDPALVRRNLVYLGIQLVADMQNSAVYLLNTNVLYSDTMWLSMERWAFVEQMELSLCNKQQTRMCVNRTSSEDDKTLSYELKRKIKQRQGSH